MDITRKVSKILDLAIDMGYGDTDEDFPTFDNDEKMLAWLIETISPPLVTETQFVWLGKAARSFEIRNAIPWCGPRRMPYPTFMVLVANNLIVNDSVTNLGLARLLIGLEQEEPT